MFFPGVDAMKFGVVFVVALNFKVRETIISKEKRAKNVCEKNIYTKCHK